MEVLAVLVMAIIFLIGAPICWRWSLYNPHNVEKLKILHNKEKELKIQIHAVEVLRKEIISKDKMAWNKFNKSIQGG